MQKIQLYSAHGEAQAFISARKAARMLADGDAVPVFAGRGVHRRVVAVQRAMGQAVVASPCGISAADMRQATEGSVRARLKIEHWPTTGCPAWRHAQ